MLSLSCDPKKHQEDKNITPSRKLAGPCETLFSEIPGFSSEMDHLSGRFQVMATSDNSPQKGNMPMKNSRLQEGNTSSNGGSPFAMLVFGVTLPTLRCWSLDLFWIIERLRQMKFEE